MDDSDPRDLLSRINGEVDGLNLAPLTQHYRGDDLLTLARWQAAYLLAGLPFGRSKGDGEILRELTKHGFVEASGGRTKASSHRLTWKGLLASLPGDGLTGRDIWAELSKLSKMGEEIAGFRICPAAGSGDGDAYAVEIGDFEDILSPLMALGLAELKLDRSGRLWNVRITDKARAALHDPPDLDQAIGTHFDFDSWCAGRTYAKRYATATPPPSVRNLVPRALSCAAWEGMPVRKKRATKQQANRPERETR